MNHWLNALLAQAAPKILVTVADVAGSGPREPGAKMVVTPDQAFDTIGGGHLEMRAIEMAREMLKMPAGSVAAERRLERLPLGPSLGQCCGGVVHLAFERISPEAQASLNGLSQRWRSGLDTWRRVSLDTLAVPVLCDAAGASHITQDAAGQRWLVDACLAWRPHLMLFGAGHVGTAIVRALAELPCRVTWVDEREDMFPPVLPANVRHEVTDTPQALIAAAAPGTSFLVLTHSHALDQLLSEHVLRRSDFSWFGLIGSKTKRMQFEHRLRERGIPAVRLRDMVCPIGLPGIRGKEPAVIAASVAAQLLQVWDALAQ